MEKVIEKIMSSIDKLNVCETEKVALRAEVNGLFSEIKAQNLRIAHINLSLDDLDTPEKIRFILNKIRNGKKQKVNGSCANGSNVVPSVKSPSNSIKPIKKTKPVKH